MVKSGIFRRYLIIIKGKYSINRLMLYLHLHQTMFGLQEKEFNIGMGISFQM